MSRWAFAKRIVMVCGVLLVATGLALAGWFEIASSITSHKLRDRTAYWREVVDSGVAVGEPGHQAGRWFRSRFPTGVDDVSVPGRHSLVASAEYIKELGLNYPCAEWEVVVEVRVGPDNRVVSRDVKVDGACV